MAIKLNCVLWHFHISLHRHHCSECLINEKSMVLTLLPSDWLLYDVSLSRELYAGPKVDFTLHLQMKTLLRQHGKTSRETDWYGEISRGSIDLFIPIYTQHLIDCHVELEARQKLSKEDWNWAPPKVAVRSTWKFAGLWLLIYRSIYEKLLDFIRSLFLCYSVIRAVYNSLFSQIKSNKIILLLYFAEGSNGVKSRSSRNMVRCRKKTMGGNLSVVWLNFALCEDYWKVLLLAH